MHKTALIALLALSALMFAANGPREDLKYQAVIEWKHHGLDFRVLVNVKPVGDGQLVMIRQQVVNAIMATMIGYPSNSPLDGIAKELTDGYGFASAEVVRTDSDGVRVGIVAAQ